jgi:hypothetical protein
MISELDRLIAEASVLAGGKHPCNVLGHSWVFSGGANCGCENGGCSIPAQRVGVFQEADDEETPGKCFETWFERACADRTVCDKLAKEVQLSPNEDYQLAYRPKPRH